MRFSVLKENLYNGLSVVSSITSKNLTLPILQNVKMVAGQGSVEFSTTNLEIGIRYKVRGKVDEPGEMTVPARVFLEIVNTLPNERVDCRSEENTLHAECANSKTALRGVAAEEFPVIPTLSDGIEISCEAKECVDALEQILFSVASDESRPEIHGVYANAEKETLTLASTDGFRLSERQVSLVGGVGDRQIMKIIPSRTLQELERLVGHGGENGAVQWVIGENQLLLRYGNGEIVSRVIEGKYPDYRQVIPSAHKTTVTVATKELLQLVRGAGLFCRSGMNDVRCYFSPEQKELRVRAANTQIGEYDAAVSAQVAGEENDIALNYRFFLDGLAALKSDLVVLEMTEKNNPIVLKAAEGKRKYLHLIMPIKQ
ncbi:MAG: DNA polymerase III subunit beta [Deltaproteobacteria bacterium RIFCSPLOWO2_02_FULL_46_8]|nr:MAG: DNA polymerase III subunit beta [Deltaproteobacteria bacterium RIFCSPLOWO2_02_FULL_46_8]